MKAPVIIFGNPGISGNKIVTQQRIQKSSCVSYEPSSRRGIYIECERNGNGSVVGMSVTEHGADWLAAKQAEAS